MERNGVKLGHRVATNFVRLLQASTSIDAATKTPLYPKIKSFGLGLYNFADEDGTFAQWLIKNPYSDDESSSLIAQVMKGSDLDPDQEKLGVAIIVSQIKPPQGV